MDSFKTKEVQGFYHRMDYVAKPENDQDAQILFSKSVLTTQGNSECALDLQFMNQRGITRSYMVFGHHMMLLITCVISLMA